VRLGLNRTHGGDRASHPRGHFDGHSEAQGNRFSHHSRSDGPFNPQHSSRGHFNGQDEAGRTGNRHDSRDARLGFQRGNDHNWNHHSSQIINRANHELRDSLRNLRSELSAFRSNFNDGHRTIGLTDRHIERVLDLTTRGLQNTFDHRGHSERIGRNTIADATGIVSVAEHFSRLEPTGGEPVRRTFETVMNFLLRDGLTERHTEPARLRLITELLRDVRSGAFLHPRDSEGPFPLTGRARIVSEMMSLMRTIEAIERFADEMRGNPNRSFIADWSVFSRGGVFNGIIGREVLELLAQAIANSGPTFPGLAGRLEIPRLIAAVEGVLTDTAGRPLIVADGSPLKLGELLWFNARPDSAIDLWALDRFPTRLSPLLVHGFDAVYSLIGFDGRQLSLPRFMAIQSQINASDFEWLFGEEPLSERWIRSAIEVLKDSISVDHNVLGELLEEAISCGRFHLTVMRGTVEDGRAVSGSFSFMPVQNFSPAFGSVPL
jgi:hypothetical protein